MSRIPDKLNRTKTTVSNVTSQRTTLSNYFLSNSSSSRKRSTAKNYTTDVVPVKVPKSTETQSPVIPGDFLSVVTKEKLSSFSFSKLRQPIPASELSNDLGFPDEFLDNICYSESEDTQIGGEKEATCVSNNVKYTPLENQYFKFKKEYPDVVLLIECGYKYRFFGDDAKIASKELNVACYKDHNLVSAIVPTHRLHIHVQRLVSKNYKVGVIKQTEAAALKANKNSLFSRKLHAIYTKSTLIGDEFPFQTVGSGEEAADTGSGFIVCINEETLKNVNNSPSSIAVLAVQPISGDMFYSSFQDSLHRPQLEGILLRINPSEIFYPRLGLNKKTEHLLKFEFIQWSKHLRIEALDDNIFNYAFAVNKVSSFYDSSSGGDEMDVLHSVLSLPPLVICCLSALIVHLSTLKLEKILRSLNDIQPLSKLSDHMALNAAALRNLEIFEPEHGSLFWMLNKTFTKFGERLLRLWISQPLKIVEKINNRLDAVTEVVQSESLVFSELERIISKLPDLERMLCSAFYHRCSCSEFLHLVQSLTSLKDGFHNLSHMVQVEVKTARLKDLFSVTFFLLSDVEKFCSNINKNAAREEDKQNFFLNTTLYTAVENCEKEIKHLEQQLDNLKIDICKVLRLPAFKYSTISGQKYLIEIPNSLVTLVPCDWTKISGTKQFSRFRSPEVTRLLSELEQQRAISTKACDAAWHLFLDEFGKCFHKYKKAISHLAELDCYLCFAKIAKEEHYCRPIVLEDSSRKLDINQGRHPIAMKMMGVDVQFVANDTKLNCVERCLVVTGPNMGGKSTYIRQVALILLMAHMGCYVPAASATLPLCDGIYVRMGVDDDLDSNRSTFMTEMGEAADILASASDRSLVILDELGRGTGTHDGALVALATLEHLISKIQCLALFVTHYPQVVDLQNKFPENIRSATMAFVVEDSENESLVFLYNLVAGTSQKSYGINVARLAQIPKPLLLQAQNKSHHFAQQLSGRRKLTSILKKLSSLPKSSIINKLQNLTITMES